MTESHLMVAQGYTTQGYFDGHEQFCKHVSFFWTEAFRFKCPFIVVFDISLDHNIFGTKSQLKSGIPPAPARLALTHPVPFVGSARTLALTALCYIALSCSAFHLDEVSWISRLRLDQ